MTRPDSTLITAILDRSASMAGLEQATISGFNEFLKGQRATPGEAKISLVLFNHDYDVVYLAKDVKEAPELTREVYFTRGSTALLDAIGRTIIETGKTLAAMPEEERPGKVIVIIDTDGAENTSKKFDKHKINDLITEHTNVWKWDFIFLGANQDAIMTAASIGIAPNKAMNTRATLDGMGHKYGSMSAYTTRGRASGQSIQSNSFSDEERSENA